MSRHGENIRKRKDGRWEGRYSVHEPQTDRRIVRSVYAGTYAEVKEKLISVKKSDRYTLDSKKTNDSPDFCAVAREWLTAVEQTKKYATYRKYRCVYETYIERELQAYTLSQPDGSCLSKLLQKCMDQAQSESIKRSVACVLNQISSYAEIYYHTTHFQYSAPKQSRISRPAVVFNQTEQAKLLQYLYHEMDIYKLGIVLCISTGLRLGEICSLKWKDIDLSEKVLHVNTTVQRIAVDHPAHKTILLEGDPKSLFSKREIPLSEDMVRLLRTYYNISATYVLNMDRPMEPRTYQNKFQHYLKKAGVEKKNFHTLRHTFATNCISSGTDIKSLSEILGHSDVKITLNRYVHPTLETKRQHMNSLSFVYGRIVGQQ